MEQNAHNQNTRKIEEKALETHPKNIHSLRIIIPNTVENQK